MEVPSIDNLRAATKSTRRYGFIGTALALIWGLTGQLWEHAVLSWIDETIGKEAEKMEPLKTLFAHPFILVPVVIATWAIWTIVLAHIKDGKARVAEAESASRDPAPNRIEQTITGSGNKQAGRDLIETYIHHDPLVAARLEEFQQIDDFLVKKDEIQLRETFDFPDMLKFNITLAKNFHWPGTVPPREMKEMTEFFGGGNSVMHRRFLDQHRVGNDLYMKGKPGKLYLVNTSKKCAEARAILMSLSSSSKMPLSVVAALTTFDKTVQDNIEMFIVSLNDSFEHNQRNIKESGDIESDKQGAAWNYYWGRFIHLRPKAEAVSLAIRSFLESERA